MAATLYLVDGMSHIYRAYHAIQGLTNKAGLPTNAAYGFANMLRKLIEEEDPDYLGVAIDVSGPTVRHERYTEYKATRRPMPEDLSRQIPYILRLCEVLRIPVLSCPGYEADDVIGTLVRRAREKQLEVVIVTIDKDMFQLVAEHVTVLDTRTMTRLNPATVEEKFGVPPQQVVDVLSLVGDSSDNIPGARGIGAKGARQLVRRYGSLDNLLRRSHEVSRKSYRESLQENEELILQSRDLLTIHDDLPLDLDLDHLKLADPDSRAAQDLFAELGFSSLLEAFVPAPETAAVDFSEIQTSPDLQALVAQLEARPASLAVLFPEDQPLEGSASAMAVGGPDQKVWLLPFSVLPEFSGEMPGLLAAPEVWIIHDLKPLYFLARRLKWVLPEDFQDTMLMAYLVNPNQNNFSIEKLALEYLHYRLAESNGDHPSLLGNQQMDSLCERAAVTLRLWETLRPQLREKNLEKLLLEIEIPLVGVLARMEERGVKVDCALLQRMSHELGQEIDQLSERIFEIAGQEFNLNSPRQLSEILFEKLNLPVAKKTRKGGHYATGVEVLEELGVSYEIARLILEYRELTKLKNTYLDALPKLVHQQTGRIHTSYNQTVTATGRLSSSNPNLQNIPIKSEVGRRIRRAFVPEPGCWIMAADYSQIELRIMAHLSRDPVLVEAFLRGEDIHERTAREVFGMRAMMDPHEYRRHAKVINFGIMYGLSAFGLARNLKIDRQEAQRFIDGYFEKYSGVKAWIDSTLAEARDKGYVQTLFGRIRPIPEIHSNNWNLRNFAERTAINAPIQGTAADLIKKAMIAIERRIQRRGLRGMLIMQVHDELVFEVPESEVEPMRDLVKTEMEQAAELAVPLQVEVGVGNSWYQAK